ncbi:membrane integrity-associated transporter subunit PqiC [Thermodesulfobacteriota bacterium]
MLRSFLRIMLFLCFVPAGSFIDGCMTSSTPTTRFYVLTPLDAGSPLVNKSEHRGSLSVEVASLRLPQYLERPQIVTRSGENRLERAEYHQWGGNLRKNMIRVLAKNLSELLVTPNIVISPHRPPAPPDFRVEIEVMQFERDADKRVKLSAQWRLSRGKDLKTLTTQITELESPTVSAGSDYESTVSAMSGLIGELSKIIGREILKHARERFDT